MITWLLVLLIACGVGAWLFLTWYHADNEPMFGPRSNTRVTFVAVLHNLMRDTRDLLKLDVACAWVVANAPPLAIGALDLYAVADPSLREALMQVPAGWAMAPGALILLGLNIVARFKVAGR